MKSPQGRYEAPPNTETDPVSRFPTNTREEQGRIRAGWEAALGTGLHAVLGEQGQAEWSDSSGLSAPAPHLGPVPLLGHHLCLLLQQGAGELLRLPRLLLFLRLLLVRFPGLQLVLCNLGTQSKSPETRPRGRAPPLTRREPVDLPSGRVRGSTSGGK